MTTGYGSTLACVTRVVTASGNFNSRFDFEHIKFFYKVRETHTSIPGLDKSKVPQPTPDLVGAARTIGGANRW